MRRMAQQAQAGAGTDDSPCAAWAVVATVAAPRRVQPLLRGTMAITCAECGCLVDRGVIVTPCDAYPECCCTDLPLRPED